MRARVQVPDIARAMELGREAADFVSQTFVKPIKLEFEKVQTAAPPPSSYSHASHRCHAMAAIPDTQLISIPVPVPPVRVPALSPELEYQPQAAGNVLVERPGLHGGAGLLSAPAHE